MSAVDTRIGARQEATNTPTVVTGIPESDVQSALAWLYSYLTGGVPHDTVLDGDLEVTGDLLVDGASHLVGNTTIDGTLKVGGGATIAEIDTDGTLAHNGDDRIATQKATKTYSDKKILGPGTVVSGDIVQFSGTTGLAVQDGGKSFSTDGTLSGNSDSLISTQKAVKTYVDQIIAAQDAMVFKGATDCSANPNYPAADRGWTYRVSVAGKIGGASGTVVEAGDLFMCLDDSTASGDQATVGAHWTIAQTNIDGAVVGPASAVGDDFATFNSTSGKIIKDSGLSRSTDGTFASNSDTLIPSQKAAKTYADLKLAKASNLSDVANVATSRSNLGLDTANTPQFAGIEMGNASDTTLTRSAAGVLAVEGINALLAGKTDVISKGFTLTPNSLGNIASSFTPDPTLGNYQYGTNHVASTWSAPSSDCAIDILVTNDATAGAITFSGFTVGSSTGSALDTTSGHKFIISIRRINSVATYSVYALQ